MAVLGVDLKGVLLSVAPAVVSKTATAPIDRIKCLMQTQNENVRQLRLRTPYKGIVDCVRHTLNTEGVRGLWRSNLIGCTAYFPSQASNIYFYRKIKSRLEANKNDQYPMIFCKNVASGGLAGAISLCLTYPFEFVRVKFATDAKPNAGAKYRYQRILRDSIVKSRRSGGVKALYRGLGISLIGIIVYRGCYFGLYESLRPILLGEDAGFLLSFGLGYGVTVTSGLITYPLDTIRCRMIMRVGAPISVQYKGPIDCASKIVKTEGYMSLMKGAAVNIIRGLAGAGILVGLDKFEQLYLDMRVN